MSNAAGFPRTSPISLAGGVLLDARHVCGVFDGPIEAHQALVPFIVDGLERGERAVHVVDPARRATHIEWLAGAGIDVRGALDSGQLEVPTWSEVYLAGGRFDEARVRAFILEKIAEGGANGFPLTRFIGYMEWALQELPGVDDLMQYEAGIDAILRGVPDPVICVYDLERHPPGAMAKALDVHPLSIVDGRLRPSHTATTSARDRILRAATQHFFRYGIGPTGVDTLIGSAGVAKATFYRHFPSKDDLIVAWLLDSRTRWLEQMRLRAEERARSPQEVIPALFAEVAEWLESHDYRGCPYLNSSVEIGDPSHPALEVVQDFLADVEAYLRNALVAMGRRDAATLAEEAQALLAGGIALSVARRSTAPALAARSAVIRLIGESDAIEDRGPT